MAHFIYSRSTLTANFIITAYQKSDIGEMIPYITAKDGGNPTAN